MKAWMFHIITDVYGDIPYTDALGDKIYPKYDTQESIYRDLLKELKEADAQINTGDAAVQGDIIYQGDMGRWVKFANALRIRVATRMADRDWATAKRILKRLLKINSQAMPTTLYSNLQLLLRTTIH